MPSPAVIHFPPPYTPSRLHFRFPPVYFPCLPQPTTPRSSSRPTPRAVVPLDLTRHHPPHCFGSLLTPLLCVLLLPHKASFSVCVRSSCAPINTSSCSCGPHPGSRLLPNGTHPVSSIQSTASRLWLFKKSFHEPFVFSLFVMPPEGTLTLAQKP